MKIILNPDLYHGANKKSNFFEGWYFKIVDKNNLYKFAFIPGIALGSNASERHSFIQVVDGYSINYNYIKFDGDEFKFDNSKNTLDVSVSSNKFTLNSMSLDLDYIDSKNKLQNTIKGSLSFTNIFKWPDNVLAPGSMGFYNYLLFMECYSQVCALDGDINGKLIINGKEVDFTGGKVYIEKNWGSSFPMSWFWVQSNNFKDPSVSITCSLGTIPFPIKDFRGFLIGLKVKDKFYDFTTANRSKVTLTNSGKDAKLVATKKYLRLTIETKTNKDEFMLCLGPKNGDMVPLVEETLCGSVFVKLEDTKNNTVIYEGIGKSTGVEYGGDMMNIFDTI